MYFRAWFVPDEARFVLKAKSPVKSDPKPTILAHWVCPLSLLISRNSTPIGSQLVMSLTLIRKWATRSRLTVSSRGNMFLPIFVTFWTGWSIRWGIRWTFGQKMTYASWDAPDRPNKCFLASWKIVFVTKVPRTSRSQSKKPSYKSTMAICGCGQ